MIGAWLQAQAWKIGTGAATLAALGLGAALVVAKIENGQFIKANDKLTAEATSLRRDLGICRSNVTALEGSLQVQTDAVKALKDVSDRKMDAAETALKATAAQVTRLGDRAGAILAYTPKGEDACARTRDIRRQYQEGLK